MPTKLKDEVYICPMIKLDAITVIVIDLETLHINELLDTEKNHDSKY